MGGERNGGGLESTHNLMILGLKRGSRREIWGGGELGGASPFTNRALTEGPGKKKWWKGHKKEFLTHRKSKGRKRVRIWGGNKSLRQMRGLGGDD